LECGVELLMVVENRKSVSRPHSVSAPATLLRRKAKMKEINQSIS